MIAIPNMEKPKSCGECEFNYNLEGGSYEWWECVILHDDINQFDTRQTDCPLIDIVTCGECKHLEVINKAPIYAHCHKWSYDFELWQEDTRKSFCSYGERRANDSDT